MCENKMAVSVVKPISRNGHVLSRIRECDWLNRLFLFADRKLLPTLGPGKVKIQILFLFPQSGQNGVVFRLKPFA